MNENSESFSYKFQRLRERIREAVAKGELSGKLPGERSLAKQFQVNAKTLSKALTDLAAEGILDRSIGRGTYVKGHAPAAAATAARWLVLTDDDDASNGLVESLRKHNEGLHTMTDMVDRIRPSFINQFSAVIDLASNTPELFFRDLAVRNISVVAVGREPKTYSMNAVVIDLQLGASRLARDLALAGHRKFAVVAKRGDTGFAQAVTRATAPFEPGSTIDVVFASEVPMAVQAGATAVICDSTANAREAGKALTDAGRNVPIVAVGVAEGAAPCAGFFVSTDQIATAVTDLLSQAQTARPTVLWLAGDFTHRDATPTPIANGRGYNGLRAGAAQ